MTSFEDVGKQFVQFYYSTFDDNPANLAPLYRDHSMLSFEAEGNVGAQAIVAKLQGLRFGKIQHRTDTVDAQPVGDDAIIVLVTGALIIDGQDRPMNFSQAFQLRKEIANGAESWYVFNDIFRLVYPAA